MKQFLILLMSVSMAVANSVSLKYKVEVDGYYDSNIGQNVTEESSLYAVPSVGLSLAVPLGPIDLLAGGTITYENYLQKRLATLNAPFLLPYMGVKGEFGPLSTTLRARYAVYYSYTFVVAKLSYRLESDNRISLKKRRYLHINGGVMYNDYASSSSDGMRYTTELSYEKRYRKLITSVEPFLEGEFNRAKSDTASYDQLEVGLKSGFDLNIIDADLSVSLKSKTYGASYEHPHTMELFTPRNKYVEANVSLSRKIFKKMKIALSGKMRFKSSTNPTMDYDRHTIGLTLRWSDVIL